MLSTLLLSLPLGATAASRSHPKRCDDDDPPASGPRTILAGTYNTSILTLTFTPPSTLELTAVEDTSAEKWGPNTAPSWIEPSATHEDLAFVADEGEKGQAVVFNTSSLEVLGVQGTKGFGPAHLGTTQDGEWLLAPNYGEGNFLGINLNPTYGTFAFQTQQPVDFNDDKLGPDASQTAPQPHMAIEHPTSKHVFIPMRGSDQIHELSLEQGETGPQWTIVNDIAIEPAGSGPRHLRFNDDGTVAYLLNEITSALHVYDVDASGDVSAWTKVSEHNILPEGATPVPEAPLAAGEIQITKDGSALYCSNRDDANPEGDAIAVFELDPPFSNNVASGPDFYRSGGVHIRGMELSEDEAFRVAGNQLSGSVALFKRNDDNSLERVALLETDYRTTTFLWV